MSRSVQREAAGTLQLVSVHADHSRRSSGLGTCLARDSISQDLSSPRSVRPSCATMMFDRSILGRNGSGRPISSWRRTLGLAMLRRGSGLESLRKRDGHMLCCTGQGTPDWDRWQKFECVVVKQFLANCVSVLWARSHRWPRWYLSPACFISLSVMSRGIITDVSSSSLGQGVLHALQSALPGVLAVLSSPLLCAFSFASAS